MNYIRSIAVSSLGVTIFCAWVFRDHLRQSRIVSNFCQRVSGLFSLSWWARGSSRPEVESESSKDTSLLDLVAPDTGPVIVVAESSAPEPSLEEVDQKYWHSILSWAGEVCQPMHAYVSS